MKGKLTGGTVRGWIKLHMGKLMTNHAMLGTPQTHPFCHDMIRVALSACKAFIQLVFGAEAEFLPVCSRGWTE